MKRYPILLLLLTFAICGLHGQPLQVWPGDANNNGLVNNIDLLQVGLAYNYFGPSRDSTFVGWQAQTAQAWPQTLGNGVNVAYVDADGNGLVNYYYDAFPIYVHYGFKHGPTTPDVFPAGTPGVDPKLDLDENGVPQPVQGGTVINLPLLLGTQALPVDNLYGLAFSLHVDPKFVDVDEVDINFNQYSWANPDNKRIYAAYRASSSRLDVAWVRTDHNERDGFGPIGTVSIVIIDDVISLEQQFQIRIDSIQLIDRFGNKTAIAGDTLLLTVQPDDAATSDHEPHTAQISVWPNPAQDRLYFRATEPLQEAVLFDTQGREMARTAAPGTAGEWPLPGIPPGMYYLEIRTRERVFREKILFR